MVGIRVTVGVVCLIVGDDMDSGMMGIDDGVRVIVGVGILVGIGIGVLVGIGIGVLVGTRVGVLVGVGVGVSVGVGVGEVNISGTSNITGTSGKSTNILLFCI